MEQLPRYHLRGKLFPGMFPSERAIMFEDSQGRTVSVLIAERAVTSLGDEGLIEVTLVDERGDLKLVSLPGEVFGAGRMATVRAEQLQPVPQPA